MATPENLSADKLPLDAFPGNLKRHVDPKAPPPFRDMGAKGLVPGISPEHLAMVLFQLQFDPDTNIRKTAQDTFADLPPEMIQTIATANLPAAVLDFCARRWLKRDSAIQRLITNPAVEDLTFAFLANKGNETLTDIIGDNQVRLLRSPVIIEQLYLNPATRQNVIDRILELALREKIELAEFPALNSAIKAANRELVEEARREAEATAEAPLVPDGEGLEESQFSALLAEAAAEGDQQLAEAAAEEDVDPRRRRREERDNDDDGEEEEQSERVISLQVQIQNMRISEKVRLANLGNKEARSLLVRDQNRLVHMAVVNSPKITPPEYYDFAGNKNLPAGVINYIANRRQTMRDYQLVLKLVANPKLHLRTATRMLNYLRPNDLKSLTKNRHVSPQLGKLAKNLLRKRGQ